jgi:hypothetical protein
LTKISDDERAQSRSVSLRGKEWKKVEEISKRLGLGITDFIRSCFELGTEKYANGNDAANADSVTVVLRGIKAAKKFVHNHRHDPKACEPLWRHTSELHEYLKQIITKKQTLSKKELARREIQEIAEKESSRLGISNSEEEVIEGEKEEQEQEQEEEPVEDEEVITEE